MKRSARSSSEQSPKAGPSRSRGRAAEREGPAGAPAARIGPALALAALAVALGCLVLAPLALALEPPQIRGELLEETVFATRAHIEPQIETGRGPVEWSCEYATSEAALAAGEGVPAGSGQTGAADIELVACGALDFAAGDSAAAAVIHHLLPATTYFLRFDVGSSAGEATRIFSFTTAAPAAPEIASFAGAVHHTTFTDNGPAPQGPTRHSFSAQIETNGLATGYRFEFTTEPENAGSWLPFTSGATGTISVAEDFAHAEAELSGLTPETTYFVRLRATSAKGSVEQTTYTGAASNQFESFTTPTARPIVRAPQARNVTAAGAYLTGGGALLPQGSETHWRFEVATSRSGPWTPAAGAAGVVTQAEAEAVPEGAGPGDIEGRLSGLQPATTYFVRLFAENVAGEAEVCTEGTGDHLGQVSCEPLSSAADPPLLSFRTAGPPLPTTFPTSALHGEAVRIIGTVDPGSAATSEEQQVAIEGAPGAGTFTLSFGGQSTGPIAATAPAEAVAAALGALPALSDPGLVVGGRPGGPYTVYFGGSEAETDQPQLLADGSGLTPPGAVVVTTTQAGGEAFVASAHFEYEGLAGAGAPFADASSTANVALGSGDVPKFAAVDLAGLAAGESYRYRIVAGNDSPGAPIVAGAEETLTVPASSPVPSPAPCPDEALRVGPSANLPDCRAYEQLTPADKEGAQELFTYGVGVGNGGLAGTDGEHFVLEAPSINWGAGPDAGQAPYFFAHSQAGWQMTAGSPQPATGVAHVVPQLFRADLAEYAFASDIHTSAGVGESEAIEYKAGPPGGPYETVASVPRADVNEGGPHDGWVAASADFTKLVLQVEDHQLLGSPTGTRAGADLYEYAGGELRQLNVADGGGKLGVCGASIVDGEAEKPGAISSADAVSADGSRVFFEAVPSGHGCEEAKHLYLRTDGTQTTDIGPYRFLAANSAGTRVLLESRSGEARGFLIYDAEAGGPPAPLSGLTLHASPLDLNVSRDLTAIYFLSSEQLTAAAPPSGVLLTGGHGEGVTTGLNLYRYDIADESLRFVDQAAPSANEIGGLNVTPDGRYAYFEAEGVGGVPGGALYHPSFEGSVTSEEIPSTQLYRYDAVEARIECMSCASPFAPEPGASARFGGASGDEGRAKSQAGTPTLTFVTADGDLAFFDTAAALVPADVDGQVTPEANGENPGSNAEESISSDVYEWRRDGVGDCGRAQGCLALITNGRGGFQNMLLGTAAEGRDVFIYTHSQLGPRDQDSAGDIYDARSGGGEVPPPSRPVECEGDACHHPRAAPAEPTLSTSVPSGEGNVTARPHKASKRHRHKHRRHHKHKKGRLRHKTAGRKRGATR